MPAFGTPRPYRRYNTPPLTPGEINDVTEYLLSPQHQTSDPDSSRRGRALYHDPIRGQCWDCHGDRAQGDASIGAPDLLDATWLYGNGSRTDIRESLTHGRAGTCPGWRGKLAPAMITAIAVYTHTLSQSRP